MQSNFFNTNIVRNHDINTELNNSMANTYDWCLGMAEKYSVLYADADRAWYADQKRGHICYDV
jgi:hypothetical protein